MPAKKSLKRMLSAQLDKAEFEFDSLTKVMQTYNSELSMLTPMATWKHSMLPGSVFDWIMLYTHYLHEGEKRDIFWREGHYIYQRKAVERWGGGQPDIGLLASLNHSSSTEEHFRTFLTEESARSLPARTWVCSDENKKLYANGFAHAYGAFYHGGETQTTAPTPPVVDKTYLLDTLLSPVLNTGTPYSTQFKTTYVNSNGLAPVSCPKDGVSLVKDECARAKKDGVDCFMSVTRVLSLPAIKEIYKMFNAVSTALATGKIKVSHLKGIRRDSTTGEYHYREYGDLKTVSQKTCKTLTKLKLHLAHLVERYQSVDDLVRAESQCKGLYGGAVSDGEQLMGFSLKELRRKRSSYGFTYNDVLSAFRFLYDVVDSLDVEYNRDLDRYNNIIRSVTAAKEKLIPEYQEKKKEVERIAFLMQDIITNEGNVYDVWRGEETWG